jgi:DNA-binding response OmpR family regulator
MPGTNSPLRIFVVENDPDTLKYLRMYLEELGHLVFAARTVADALARIPAATCDVLISDIGLQDGTGWDLLRRLRVEAHGAPAYAIALSGFGRNADRIKSEVAGFRHHLLKPFDLADLEAMLAEAVQEHT